MKYHELVEIIKKELEATVEDMLSSPEDYRLENTIIDGVDRIENIDHDEVIKEVARQWYENRP